MWVMPLLSFLASLYMIAFSKHTFAFIIFIMPIMLHPFVAIPLSILIDSIWSFFKKCFQKGRSSKCQRNKKCASPSLSMTLYFALISTLLLCYLITWDNYVEYGKKNFKNQNITNKDLVVDGAFANRKFERCHCTQEKYSCVIVDININIEDYLKIIPSNDVLIKITIGFISLLTLCYLVEPCIGKPIHMRKFIFGSTSLENPNSSTEGEKSDENHSKKAKSKNKLAISIMMCCLGTLYVIMIISPIFLMQSDKYFKLYDFNDHECVDGYYDSHVNPNILECNGKSKS